MQQNEERYGEAHYKKMDNINVHKYSMHWWANRHLTRLVHRRVQGGRLLEIGCGTGFLLAELGRYFETYGIEISSFAINHARSNCPNANLKLLRAEDISEFPEEFFNVIVSKHVLEHLEKPGLVLTECARILQPGGLLLLIVPNMQSISRRWKGPEWHGFREETHISLLYPQEWLHLINNSGLVVEKVFSDGFWDPPYVPYVPNIIQLITFGSLGGIQALLGLSFLPVPLGEGLVVLAKKPLP